MASLEDLRARITQQQSRLYAIFMRWTDERWTDPSNFESVAAREIRQQHLQFQMDMQDAGILLAAGPLSYGDTNAERNVTAMGMYLIAAASRADAERIARSEPFFRAGLRTFTLCEWSLNEGLAWPLAREMVGKLTSAASS
jgi:uncharacterized protein YciI